MASPFSIFRKNQRLWMAGAVLIAILAFVVAPMLESFSGYSRGTRPGAGAVAASWSGGSITQEQVETELTQLAIANTFLRKLAFEVREKGGFPQVPAAASSDFGNLGITPETRDPNVIIRRKLFVEEAKRLGIHFDEQSVKTFLTRFVDGKLSGEQIQKSLREVSGGRMTLLDFNRLMKEELAQYAVLRLSDSAMRFEGRDNTQGFPMALPMAILTPPSKNWQYFQRFNRAATIEAYPVFVRDFKEAVTAEPSDRELRALFDEGKSVSQIEVEVQTQPAFMIPPKADFEFLTVNFLQVVEEEKGKIPEDVLRAEYERLVKENQFRVPDTTPAPEPMPTGGDQPSDTNRPPTLENPSQDPPNPQPTSSILPKQNPNGAKLVSFQDPPAGEPATTEPATQPTASDTPATETTSAPSATQPPVTETTGTEPAATDPAATDPALPKIRTQTFEEVKDTVARQLATGEAGKLINQRIAEIRDRMEIYSVSLRAYERAVQEKDKNAVAPESLNLQQVADQYGFQYGRTGLVDARSVLALPIGQSRISRAARMDQVEFFRLTTIPPDPYESDSPGNLYTPLTSASFTNDIFLFWKVQHDVASTPTFEAAKEDVKKLWALQRASELAEAKAREIASRVGTSSVAETLDDENQRALVVRPTPFTWFNAMFANMDRLRLSNVEGIQSIDNAFMEKIFNAQVGENIVVPDAAKEIYYVVKINSFFPNEEELLGRFAAAPNTTAVRSIANGEANQIPSAWFSNLQKQLGLRQP